MNESSNKPWHVVGQGLAGSCLAFEFFERGIPFRVIDPGVGGSSRVAAGLLNPLTGKNFQPSWMIEAFHPHAVKFYRKLEQKFGVALWHALPVMRLAETEREWLKISAKLELPEVRPWIAEPCGTETPPGFIQHVILNGGGWLDTGRFLDVLRSFFDQEGVLLQRMEETDSGHDRTILCEGSEGLIKGRLGAHRCAKGEILTLKADWPTDFIRVGAGGWLIPIGSGRFRVGSTYEWDQLDDKPTEKGMVRILEIARRLGGEDFQVADHVAAIRPIVRRSQPLMGRNVAGHWVLNGMGSKGVLYAPRMASMLADWMFEGIEPDQNVVFQPHHSGAS
ncbi:MAG: hypothetical protein RL346_507 [Verrucomicrobiota bacterium]|jgi:glycine/D-amino acid oxidase-like deaminating enzyme